jgi:hypothetical protein
LGPGQRLASLAADVMQPLSHVPLDDIRVHDDPVGQLSAAALGAQAFTFGQHIALGDPLTREMPRQWLLAHEVAHTIQQHPMNRRQSAGDPEANAERFASLLRSAPHGVPDLGPQPEGLARAVVARQTVDLPGNLLLVIDIDDGDFVGGCVKGDCAPSWH